MTALESRNRFTHAYDAKAAGEAQELIKSSYLPMLEAFVTRLAERGNE